MEMCGPATRTAMSEYGASPRITQSARPSKPCTLTSGKSRIALKGHLLSCSLLCEEVFLMDPSCKHWIYRVSIGSSLRYHRLGTSAGLCGVGRNLE